MRYFEGAVMSVPPKLGIVKAHKKNPCRREPAGVTPRLPRRRTGDGRLDGVELLFRVFGTAATAVGIFLAAELDVHLFGDPDEQRHDRDLALADMVDHDDRDAGIAVDAAAPKRDVVVELRGDGLKGADVSGRDVTVLHG
jgi:hypothetical protein